MPTFQKPLSRTSSSSSVLSDGTHGTSTNDEMGPPNTPSSEITDSAPKRTRKRFTNAQLTLLEDLFHQTSHPTREQRDALAKEAGLEIRSVTVWFQNKRQTERKVALSNGIAPPLPRKGHDSNSATPSRSACSTPPISTPRSAASSSRLSNHSRTHSATHRYPSLDDVASRSERPQHPPRTPPRSRTNSFPTIDTDPTPRSQSQGHAGTSSSVATTSRSISTERALWENMPSSPIGPSSPERKRDRDLVDFGRRTIGSRRTWTLEWACAAARISTRPQEESDEEGDGLEGDPERTIRGRDGRGNSGINATSRKAPKPLASQRVRPRVRVNEIGVRIPVEESMDGMDLDVGGDTEDEGDPPHEAVTPSSSMSLGAQSTTKNRRLPLDEGDSSTLKARGKGPEPRKVARKGSKHDEEMMDAALALCGLGRR
ncbi:hypothetical protein NLI96_g5552 [Meripilus lineatus]|uniref:Homeobox domain-containing protein n=1 Tax=Meripilus lineatus TaxID=2056292 RepID=A0AAD5V2M1_9APHY|nr:hypothetical protein NLI96_g5552 [Physisporinus lineatus]